MSFITTANFETQPDMILIFHGAMALCQRNSPDQFEFGCHSDTGAKKHFLGVTIGNAIGNTFANQAQLPFPPNSNFIFSVEGATASPARVYLPSSSNARSFSQVIDIEKIYKKRVSKKHINFPNLIIVKNGVLYTKAYTSSTFTLESTSPKSRAEMIAINVNFNGGEGVLKFKGGEKRFPRGNNPHVIYFENDCIDGIDKCSWKPYHSTKPEERNDFYMNYKNVIDKTLIAKEYELKISDDSANGPVSTHRPYIPVPFQTKMKGKKMSSDDAPCQSTGYGGTPGWEPPPGSGNP